MEEAKLKSWNDGVLKRQGIKQKSLSPKVVRSVGDAKRATLFDGTVVTRQDMIYVDGYGLVKCAPYELHFIYEIPDAETHKGWGLMCTCGSIAGVVGLNAYSKFVSPTSDGKMLVCVRHTAVKNNTGIGKHADESTE